VGNRPDALSQLFADASTHLCPRGIVIFDCRQVVTEFFVLTVEFGSQLDVTQADRPALSIVGG
jgi:hypothetical protein